MKFLPILILAFLPSGLFGQCGQPAAFNFQVAPQNDVAVLCQQALAQLQIQHTVTTTSYATLAPAITYAMPAPMAVSYAAPAFAVAMPSYGYSSFAAFAPSYAVNRVAVRSYGGYGFSGGNTVIVNNGRRFNQVAVRGGGNTVIVNNNARRFGGGFGGGGGGAIRNLLGLAATGAGAFGGASVGGPIGAIFGGIAGQAVGQAITGR